MKIHEYNHKQILKNAHLDTALAVERAKKWYGVKLKYKEVFSVYLKAGYARAKQAAYEAANPDIFIPVFYNRFATSLQSAKMMN